MFRLGVNQIARTSGARYVHIGENEVPILGHFVWFGVDWNTLGVPGDKIPPSIYRRQTRIARNHSGL